MLITEPAAGLVHAGRQAREAGAGGGGGG